MKEGTGFPAGIFYELHGAFWGWEDVEFVMPAGAAGNRSNAWSSRAERQEMQLLVRDCAQVNVSYAAFINIGRDEESSQAIQIAGSNDILWLAPGVGVIKALRESVFRQDVNEVLLIDSEELSFMWFVE